MQDGAHWASQGSETQAYKRCRIGVTGQSLSAGHTPQSAQGPGLTPVTWALERVGYSNCGGVEETQDATSHPTC